MIQLTRIVWKGDQLAQIQQFHNNFDTVLQIIPDHLLSEAYVLECYEQQITKSVVLKEKADKKNKRKARRLGASSCFSLKGFGARRAFWV